MSIYYRGDDREPNKVFETGFRSYTELVDFSRELKDQTIMRQPFDAAGAGISCTIDWRVAAFFPQFRYNPTLTSYIYVFANAKDPLSFLDFHANSFQETLSRIEPSLVEDNDPDFTDSDRVEVKNFVLREWAKEMRVANVTADAIACALQIRRTPDQKQLNISSFKIEDVIDNRRFNRKYKSEVIEKIKYKLMRICMRQEQVYLPAFYTADERNKLGQVFVKFLLEYRRYLKLEEHQRPDSVMLFEAIKAKYFFHKRPDNTTRNSDEANQIANDSNISDAES